MLVHPLPLGGDEHHIHAVGLVVVVEDREVQIDVVDVEGNVVLGLVRERFAQRVGVLARQVHAAHDHGVAGNGGGDEVALDLVLVQELADRLTHGPLVDDRTVDDGLLGQLGHSEMSQLEGQFTLRGSQRDHLDRMRPDIQPNDLSGPVQELQFPPRSDPARLSPARICTGLRQALSSGPGKKCTRMRTDAQSKPSEPRWRGLLTGAHALRPLWDGHGSPAAVPREVATPAPGIRAHLAGVETRGDENGRPDPRRGIRPTS